MKQILFIAFILIALALSAQQQNNQPGEEIILLKEKIDKQKQEIDDLNTLIIKQQNNIGQQQKQINELQSDIRKITAKSDSLNRSIEANKESISAFHERTAVQMREAEENTRTQFLRLGGDLQTNRVSGLIAVIFILLLSVGLYLWLKKYIRSAHDDMGSRIRNTQKHLDDESLRLDGKLVEILESQLKIRQEELKNRTAPVKADHSLALKVADEISRMQKNISRMDAETKGLKPLEKGIERIQANFAANGYEMVNLLHVEYDERMNLDVINFIENETIEQGKKIITKIIKPQVNFEGVLIQRAQVEVSQN